MDPSVVSRYGRQLSWFEYMYETFNITDCWTGMYYEVIRCDELVWVCVSSILESCASTSALPALPASAYASILETELIKIELRYLKVPRYLPYGTLQHTTLHYTCLTIHK